MENCKESKRLRQYREFINSETGEVFWVAVSDVLMDKPQDIRGESIKSLIVNDIDSQEVPKRALLGALKGTFQPKWGKLDMSGAYSLRIKGLTGLQYDVLMLLIESSRYGNKVEIERDVIAAKVKATTSKVSNALTVLEEKDVITRLGMGYLMFNPDIVLVGETRFRSHWRDEYRLVREKRLGRKQRRAVTTKQKQSAKIIDFVQIAQAA